MFPLLCAREREHARHLFRAHAKWREAAEIIEQNASEISS